MNPLYLIEHQGRRARYFIETDRDENSRSHVIGLIRTGEVSPVKILEIDEEAGSCRDVTEELLCEANDVLPPSNIRPVSVRGLVSSDH